MLQSWSNVYLSCRAIKADHSKYLQYDIFDVNGNSFLRAIVNSMESNRDRSIYIRLSNFVEEKGKELTLDCWVRWK